MRRRTISFGLALLLGGCLSQADSQKLAAAQTQFFAEWQARQYEAIYDGAAPELTGATTKAAFVALMQRLDAKMGACQPPVKQLDYHFNADSKGAFASQGWASACANGKLDETLTVVIRDGQAKLAGLNFTSPVLQGDQSAGDGAGPASNAAEP
jgi:hypothetical protein